MQDDLMTKIPRQADLLNTLTADIRRGKLFIAIEIDAEMIESAAIIRYLASIYGIQQVAIYGEGPGAGVIDRLRQQGLAVKELSRPPQRPQDALQRDASAQDPATDRNESLARLLQAARPSCPENTPDPANPPPPGSAAAAPQNAKSATAGHQEQTEFDKS